jgi:hypothetical protein
MEQSLGSGSRLAVAEAAGLAGAAEQLDELGAEPLHARMPLVALGSNASPRVLVHKLRRGGVSTVVVLLPCEVAGMQVGHSAHVSAAGYIAAAPLAARGARAHVMLAMVTAAQVRALDQTEPNYRRVRLDPHTHRVSVDGGADGTGAALRSAADTWVYASQWGVLADAGEPIPLQPQRELHRTLAAKDAVFADHIRGLPPHEAVQRLSSPGVREQLRLRWADPCWSRPANLLSG